MAMQFINFIYIKNKPPYLKVLDLSENNPTTITIENYDELLYFSKCQIFNELKKSQHLELQDSAIGLVTGIDPSLIEKLPKLKDDIIGFNHQYNQKLQEAAPSNPGNPQTNSTINQQTIARQIRSNRITTNQTTAQPIRPAPTIIQSIEGIQMTDYQGSRDTF